MSTLWKWQEIVGGLLMITVGVIFLVMPELAPQTELIAKAAAAVLGVCGLIYIIVYFVRRRSNVIGYDLVKAAVLIAVAVLAYLHTKELASSISLLLGILILLCGILVAQRSIDLRHFGGSAWVLFLVAALLGVIDAVLVILNPFASDKWLMYLFSGGLIFVGAFLMISAFVVGHSVSRYLEENEREEPPYKPQQAPAYKPPQQTQVYNPPPQQTQGYDRPQQTQVYDPPQQETPYVPQEPVYTPPAGEAYAAEPEIVPEERPVEMDLPEETDLPAEEKPAEGGLRGLFRRKKS